MDNIARVPPATVLGGIKGGCRRSHFRGGPIQRGGTDRGIKNEKAPWSCPQAHEKRKNRFGQAALGSAKETKETEGRSGVIYLPVQPPEEKELFNSAHRDQGAGVGNRREGMGKTNRKPRVIARGGMTNQQGRILSRVNHPGAHDSRGWRKRKTGSNTGVSHWGKKIIQVNYPKTQPRKESRKS